MDVPPNEILQDLGEGIGVVDRPDRLRWSNPRLAAAPAEVRDRFVESCAGALEHYSAVDAPERESHLQLAFSAGDRDYELTVCPASPSGDAVETVVGILWNVTERRLVQRKIDAIDEAGAELLRFDAEETRRLNVIERLQLLEQRIVESIQDVLNYDNFEIRLLDRETGQLQLVIARGLSPLKIGEVIYASADDNGISGWVASTGRGYICPDVGRDPLYKEGLRDARSSLTVPLRLHDRVIGVLNIESNTLNAFDDQDRQFAEIFARYVALAMNILDLLVIERYTTNEQVAQTVLDELESSLRTISDSAEALEGTDPGDPEVRRHVEAMREAAAVIRRKIRECTAGPQTIIDAEQELHRQDLEPTFADRRILIADDEETIRRSIGEILEQKGCVVTVCGTGTEAIEAIRSADTPYDVVISDIKMPGNSGYEVFSAARSRSGKTQVILITGFGYDPTHSIVRATQKGLSSFVFKPFKASQLVSAVRKALGGGKSGRKTKQKS